MIRLRPSGYAGRARLRAVAAVAAVLLLGGCMQHFQSSVAGSCGLFERPPYAVLGKTRYDQDVADKFVESGVAGCNWNRPAARPASLDAPMRRKAVAAPAKRKGFVRRMRDRILPAKVEEPPAAAAPQVAAPEPVQPPAPPPRSPVDILLRPSR